MASFLVWWFWLHPTSVISDHRPVVIIWKCSNNAHHHLAAIYISVLASCPLPKDSWGGGERYRDCSEGSRRFSENFFFFSPCSWVTGNALWECACWLTKNINTSDKSMRVETTDSCVPKTWFSVMFSLLIARPWTCCFTFWALSNSSARWG